MKNYFASVQKEFDYSAFVDELIPLIDQARNLDISERRQDSDVFRKWRLTVSDLTVEDEELPPEILMHPATWAG